MKRDVLAIVVGAMLAVAVIFFVQPDAMENYRFHMGSYDAAQVEDELVATVKEFDKLYVNFFTSGGDLSRLHEFPAANLVKRRIVQEINSWSEKDSIFSHDRYMFEIKDVRHFRADRGYVETAESWMYLLRNLNTGKRAKGSKRADIRVRYILYKLDGQWRVEDFEVYNIEDDIPALADTWLR